MQLRYFHGNGHPRRADSLSREDLAILIQRSRILPAHEWLDRAIRGILRPADVCLTFDGNLRCQRDIALPVLSEHRHSAFWFVCTSPLAGNIEMPEIDRLFRETRFTSISSFHTAFFDAMELSEHWPLVEMLLEERPFDGDSESKFHFVRDEVLGPLRYRDIMDRLIAAAGFDVRATAKDLWMTEADIRALHAAGHVIGLHSHTAPLKLASLDEDAQRDEYFENYAYLHNLLDERPVSMSHPENSYNQITLGILRELGIRVGFCAQASGRRTSELEYPRIGTFARVQRAAA